MTHGSVINNSILSAVADRMSVARFTGKALLRQCFASVLVLLLFMQTMFSHAALLLTSPPATLTWSTATIPAEAAVRVLRYDNIGFYRYDPVSTTSFLVQDGRFADQDSLTGTPAWRENDVLPVPIDTGTGQDLPLNTLLPLAEATDYEFSGLEPMFVVMEGPILPATAFNTRPNGYRFIAVTIDIGNGDSYTITLTETAPGSGVFVGYLQPNLPGTTVSVPPGSDVKIRYDDYGDVPDSTTASSPWNVSLPIWAANEGRKRGTTSNLPLPLNELFLSKQSLRSTAAVGDFVAYQLTLTNTGMNALPAVEITDNLPRGFRYQAKSARIGDDTVITPTVSATGQQLVFAVGDMLPGDTVTIRYVTEVTATAKTGRAVNRAVASNATAASNPANAVVLVEQALFNDRAFLVGRVIAGSCGEDDAPGLEGIRIYMEDGTNVITDKHGRWHIEGVTPGTHVLQLDTITLSPRYKLRQCFDNTRQAGNPVSRFVNVQGGTLWRENWYIEVLPGIESNIQQQLTSELLEDGTVLVTLPVKTGENRFETVTSQIFIPELLSYIPGSTTLDGQPAADLVLQDNHHEFVYKPEKYFAEYVLTFRLAVDPNVKEDTARTLLVKSTGVTAKGMPYSVSSTNRLGINRMTTSDNNITLRPRFASLSAELSNEDIININKAVQPLMGKPNLYLQVTGHTDSQAIRYRPGRLINDNYALSEARANAVADYLAQLLKIDRERITTEGKGPDLPVADNGTAEGRASNRRVAVQFRFTERASDASLAVVEGDSGIVSDTGKYMQDNNADKKKEKPGFVNIKDGMTFPQPIFSAIAQIDSRLKVKLLLNGKEVSDTRIGMRIADKESGLTRYTWVGLELAQIGSHTLELVGVDPFGIARFKQAVNVRRNGSIKTIRVAEVLENSADGRTPVAIKLLLLDEFDKPVNSNVELQIVSGELRPLNASQNNNPLDNRGNVVSVDSNGILRFEPVSTAGNYRIKLAADDTVVADIDVPVAPDLRDWILVGFAEGTLGYNTLSGNMSNLRDEEDHAYVDGETAFFARGQIKGEWLLTMAYDSRRDEEDSPLMQRIDPQKWYVLYGDDTLRSHDAPSSKKLYLRIERADFYALFGDYDTGLNVTELAAYQRTLTGIKTEYNGRYVSATGFAAETSQGFVRDDIAADGTSGLYRLSRNNIIAGSDVVEIQVRDRFTNEIIETRSMSRYVDYNIDYMDGTLYFRSPVMVQDASFNPQRIVAKYEVSAGADDVVAGGRVSIHDADKKIVVGLTTVDDNTAGANGSLVGVDATWKPDAANTLKAEVAGTRQEDINNNTANNQAWLLEHTFTSEKFDTRVRLEEKDGAFGLGQLADDDEDIRSALASARYRFTEEWSLNGDMTHQKVLSSANQRDTVEGRVEYTQENWQMYSGLRHAEDETANGSFQSQQLIVGGRRSLLDRRLTLSARGETGLSSDDNVDYPNLLSFGSEYQLTSMVALFANQDFTWSADSRAQETRVGVRATPWQGGTVSSEVSRAQDEYGPRLLAHAGVFQTVQISDQWSADFGFDRSQTLSDGSSNAETFDDRRGLANGTRNDDYTAVYAGTGYRNAQWQWTNRIEFRHADTDDKWTAMSGFQQRLDDTDTMAGRFLHFDQKMQSGSDSRSTEFDFSYSRRPLNESWFWLNRTRLVFDALDDTLGTQHGRRIVNNTHLNNVFGHRHQLSLQYGARYVHDTIDEQRFTGYTDLIGAEYRFDITSQWDIGVRGSTLASYNSNVRYSSFGIMAGYSPIKDIWISLGYNFKGFYDQDFDGAESRVSGVVLDFRIKFDQNSVRGIAGTQQE